MIAEKTTAAQQRQATGHSGQPISLGARLLLRIITDYSRADKRRGGEGWCWAGEAHLAEQLGRSVRMTRNYIRELEAVRKLETDRRGRGLTNRYRPLPPPECDRQSVAATTGNPLPPGSATGFRSDRQSVAAPISESELEAEYSSSKGAAAASVTGEEKTAPDLPVEVDATDPDVRRLAGNISRQHLDAVVLCFRARLAKKTGERIESPSAYFVSLLRRAADGWHPAPEATPPPLTGSLDRKQTLDRQWLRTQLDRQLLEQSRREAEARRQQGGTRA